MARTRRRKYTDITHLSVFGPPSTSAFGYLADRHVGPFSPQETFLRSRSEAQVTALVNAPGGDIPPEFWWAQTFLHLGAYFVPSISTSIPAAFGTDEGYLGSVTLKPRRYPIETNPGEYAVVWTAEEALVTQTARLSPETPTGPEVLFVIHGVDPDQVLAGTFLDVSVNIYLRAFTLWEDPA